MIQLALKRDPGRPLHILCLGCHSDDIEIGCGGTLLRFSNEYPGCIFHWVVLSALGERKPEAEEGLNRIVPRERLATSIFGSFRDGFMPFEGAAIKSVFEELKGTVSPDLIFTHSREDAHQDHHFIGELTWNTFRNHLIWEYEIPKYDGDFGRPSLFVPLPLEVCEQKASLLMAAFQSQLRKHWFQRETFMGLMRLRGMECNAPSGYAEAFYTRKIVV